MAEYKVEISLRNLDHALWRATLALRAAKFEFEERVRCGDARPLDHTCDAFENAREALKVAWVEMFGVTDLFEDLSINHLRGWR